MQDRLREKQNQQDRIRKKQNHAGQNKRETEPWRLYILYLANFSEDKFL